MANFIFSLLLYVAKMPFFSQIADNLSLLFVFLPQTIERIMTRLSVNINKVATLRNARGGNVPNVVKVALDCENFGADGITVHPRPDERHIRRSDVYDLRPLLRTEFNIEGYPAPEFIDMVLKVKYLTITNGVVTFAFEFDGSQGRYRFISDIPNYAEHRVSR